MRKMKKGVVAQLIYMLVLIAIAVVVGLFFMTVVEKNKKNTTEQAYADISFDATKTGVGTYAVLASKNPDEVVKNHDLDIYCYNGSAWNAAATDTAADFYAYGAGYRYEFSYDKKCEKIKINGTDTKGNSRTFLVKVIE